MFLIILFICLSVSVNCNDNDEGKYIDLLPEAEKREFLQRVARRILEEVDTKQVDKGPASVTLNNVKLDEPSSYVSKLLNEEAADLKRRSMNLKRNKTKNDTNLRGGDKQKEKYIDLTLREGLQPLELEQVNVPGQNESTSGTIVTGSGMGKESTILTTEEAVSVLPEKVIEDVIKTNDLPLIRIEKFTEILNVASSTQIGITSSPSKDKKKRNFRSNEEKIDIEITIKDTNNTKSLKMKANEEPPHVVVKDNLNTSKSGDPNKTNESKSSGTISSTPNSTTKNENLIQDDTMSPKMRTNEEIVHVANKNNLNEPIHVNANISNKSTYSDIVISTLKSVNPVENSLKNSTNRTPSLIRDTENQTISTQEKSLRNDRDIIESAREDDELQDNSRRREVNVIPEEDENDKEVNILPEDDVELVTQKNTHSIVTSDIPVVTVMSIDTPGVTVTSTITSEVSVARTDTKEVITNTDTPEVIVLSTDAPEAIISSTDGLKAGVTFTNALNNNVTSTSITTTTDNSTSTTNNFTTEGLNFRAADIIWPQVSDTVFDSAFVVNGTEVKTTTKESIMESTTDVKLISAMSTNQQKKHTENLDDLKDFKSMKSADNSIPASNISSIKKNITNLVKLNSTPNAGSPVSENQSSINEDYLIFSRRLYSHALSNEVGAYPSINEKNPLWKITQDPDSVTSENVKPNIPEFPNAPLNKDDGHLTMKKDIHLREEEKSDLELTSDNIDATTEELYFLRYNDKTSNIIGHKSELIHHSPQITTNITKYQQLPLQPFESVTQIRTTRELDTLTSENADDLTSNMENTKVELIKKKKKANKAKIYSVATSRTEAILESTSENEAKATPVKVLISKNEYPFVRAQKDGTETKISEGTTTKFSTISANESKAPLYVSTGGANLEVVPLISDDNKETTTEVQFMSVMSTKTKFSSTSPSIDSTHIERRIGERESIDSEELTTYSNTEGKGSTIREIAVDFITTESLSEVTSDKKIRLVSEPTSESANNSADKIASEWADEPVSITAYESTTEMSGEFARNFLNESTTTSAMKISSEVNDDTISETAIEVLSSSTSGSTSELATDTTTKIYTTSTSTSVSEGNKDLTSTFPSDLASAQASNLDSKPKSETTNKLINEAANEPAIKLGTETSSGTSNDASSQLPNNFASGRDSELGSEPGNEITSKLPSESANEAISESIIIEPTPQSVSKEKSEVEQPTQNKNKVDELQEGTTALPVTAPISNQNAQIEKPIDESKHNLEFTHATTENTEKNATVAETQVITTVMPLSTTDNSDVEVKTEKFDVESTSRNYDSSEMMTKVPRVVELYKPNLAKSQQLQNSKISLQLGLVPEKPVTERKFESLIKFHTAHVTKEYSVYEIRKYIVILCMNV